MKPNEWPVYAVVMDDGGLYWLDMEWGTRHGAGEGWLCVLEWGDKREPGGISAGDNRSLVDTEYVAALHRLNG